VAAQKNGVFLPKVQDEVPDFDDLAGVETDGGFIENKYGRVVDERLRKTHALPEPLGKMADDPVGDLFEAADVDDPGHLLPPLSGFDPLGFSGECEESVHGHLGVEGHTFREVTDSITHFQGFLETVQAVDLR